jgi:hypothetical protein
VLPHAAAAAAACLVLLSLPVLSPLLLWNAAEVSYNCSSATGAALPMAGFNVSITVAVQSDKGCDTVKTSDVVLTSTPLPQVTVESAPVPPFCAADGSVLVDFFVTTDVDPGLVGNEPREWELSPVVLDKTTGQVIPGTKCAVQGLIERVNPADTPGEGSACVLN